MVAGGTVTRRSTAVFVYPSLEVVVEPLGPFAAGLSGVSGFEPVLVWDHVKGRVADYLAAPRRADGLRRQRPLQVGLFTCKQGLVRARFPALAALVTTPGRLRTW